MICLHLLQLQSSTRCFFRNLLKILKLLRPMCSLSYKASVVHNHTCTFYVLRCINYSPEATSRDRIKQGYRNLECVIVVFFQKKSKRDLSPLVCCKLMLLTDCVIFCILSDSNISYFVKNLACKILILEIIILLQGFRHN